MNVMKQSVTFIVTWIILVLIGLSVISHLQQRNFENHLENISGEIEAEIEDLSRELEERWGSLDKGDPSKICNYCTLETTHYYYTYLSDFYEYMKKKEKGNILVGTFSTQANEGALLQGAIILRVTNSAESRGWDPEDEYCSILFDYSQHYSSNQVFNWEEFKSSDEYKEYTNELYDYLENKEETTLHETYQQIKNYEETAAFRDPYRKALLQSYIYLAETGYTNYQMHRNQDEFVKAVIDAGVVYSVDGFSRHLETWETVFTTLMPFQLGDFYIHSAILDLVFVLILSTHLVIIIWFVVKWKFPYLFE